jgi:hypothetical protein
MVSKKNKQLHQLLDQYLTSFELEKSFDFDQTTLKINKGDLINICTILKETQFICFF